MRWLAYEFLLVLALIGYLPKALWRRRLPHRGWCMRLGRYPEAVRRRLQSPAIWVHAVSVGEVMAAQPLIRELAAQHPRDTVVLSTVTPAGFEVATKALGERGVVIYGPLDMRWTVRRAMRAIRPRVLVLVESELWPVMVALASEQGVPVVVVNGRISERAFRRYRLVRPWLAGMLSQVAGFFMQSDVDAERIRAMGAPADRVRVMGNLKWDAGLLNLPQAAELSALASRLGLAPGTDVMVAGSTHRGEEAAVVEAWQSARRDGRPLRLIIAPRHRERVDEVEQLLRSRGVRVARMSASDAAGPWEAAIVDTMGELPRYYALATLVFVGGSLIPHGGQNPLEPASLARPVVFGPFMENFSAIAQALLDAQAARQVRTGEELVRVFAELLAAPVEAQAMGARAQALVRQVQGVAKRTADQLQPLISQHVT